MVWNHSVVGAKLTTNNTWHIVGMVSIYCVQFSEILALTFLLIPAGKLAYPS